MEQQIAQISLSNNVLSLVFNDTLINSELQHSPPRQYPWHLNFEDWFVQVPCLLMCRTNSNLNINTHASIFPMIYMA